MEKLEQINWLLFGVRILVGLICIFHGGQKFLTIIEYTSLGGVFSFVCGHNHSFLFIILAPMIEFIGGFLILSGIVIELGALLVVPAVFFVFFITNLQSDCFIPAVSARHVVNMVILAITIGFCGPGKWAIWDPGKTRRENLF